jgi:hypothetical protein
MKKLLVLIVLGAVVAAPAFAQHDPNATRRGRTSETQRPSTVRPVASITTSAVRIINRADPGRDEQRRSRAAIGYGPADLGRPSERSCEPAPGLRISATPPAFFPPPDLPDFPGRYLRMVVPVVMPKNIAARVAPT